MNASLLGLGWVGSGGCGPAASAGGFALSAGELPELSRADVFADPYRRFGRLDRFSRLGLAAVAFALRDAGLEEWQEKRPIGVIAGTRFGCLATDIDYFDTVLPEEGRLASPNLFAYTLPNCFLGEAALRFGLTGTSFIVSGGQGSVLAPLRLALQSLAWGEEETVVAGICDLPAPPGFAGPEPSPAGAIFAVLTRTPCVGYGTLSLAAQERWQFNQSPVTDWAALVGAVLAQPRPQAL